MENGNNPDDQVLLDLLARNTQLYTRALISGTEDVNGLRTTIDLLIAEIMARKQHFTLPPE